MGGAPINPTDRVGLTIAGLRQVPNSAAQAHATYLVSLLRFLADFDASAIPEPYTVASSSISIEDLLSEPASGSLIHNHAVELVGESLSREPSAWGWIGQDSQGHQIAHPTQGIAAFRGVGDVDDYLDRLLTVLRARVQPPNTHDFSAPSPLAFAEAIGYFDAVWEVRFQERLLGIMVTVQVGAGSQA